MNRLSARLRDWSRAVLRDVHALYLASRDPRVPWYAKALAVAVAVYAVSPIDIIPDFIPVLGYLDDAILLPLGILLAIRLIPPDVMAEHRARAAGIAAPPQSRAAAVVIAVLWLVALAACGWLLWRWLGAD